MIKVADLSLQYSSRVILDGVNFEVAKGKILAVVGSSGSGKTSLLSIVGGLLKPTSGEAQVGTVKVSSLSGRKRARWRLENVGFVYQAGDLLPELTPAENVALPGILQGQSSEVALATAEGLLELFEVKTAAETQNLSGGEAQRVGLARALIGDPQIMLADEPTAALDWPTAESVLEHLISQTRERQLAAIIVTHDERVAERADEQITLALTHD